MIDTVKDAISKQYGPLAGWQWALALAIPLSLYIFLSRKKVDDSTDSEDAANPNFVGNPANQLHDPGSLAILNRLEEMARVNTGRGSSVNLALLGFNLERAAELPEYAANSQTLNSWAAIVFDMVAGRKDRDENFIASVVDFMRKLGISVDELLPNPVTPPGSPDPVQPPTKPPTTKPPSNSKPKPKPKPKEKDDDDDRDDRRTPSRETYKLVSSVSGHTPQGHINVQKGLDPNTPGMADRIARGEVRYDPASNTVYEV